MANRKERELGKLKKTFSTGSFISLIITALIIIIAFSVMIKLFGRYIVDSKIRGEQSRVSEMADIYSMSENGTNRDILRVLESSGYEYIVLDEDKNVIAQSGSNTCDIANGGTLQIEAFDFHGIFGGLNFSSTDQYESTKDQFHEHVDRELQEELTEDMEGLTEDMEGLMDDLDNEVYVYPDTDLRVLVPGDYGTVKVDYEVFIRSLFGRTSIDPTLAKEGSLEKLPFWIKVPLSDKTYMAGKAYFTVYFRELLVMTGLFAVICILSLLLFAGLIIFIIKAIRNIRRMDRIFFTDDVTDGYNWLWFYKNAGIEITKRRNADKKFAILDIVFVNYRNFCVCHSVKEGEEMLCLVERKIKEHLTGREMAVHQSAAHFAALMTYSDVVELEGRIRSMIAELEHINKDHVFHFWVGVDRIEPVEDESGKKLRHRSVDIEKEYNNAGAARATITGDDSAIAFFDEKMVEEQKWIDMINESQEKALENEEFLVYYQPKYDPRTNELKGAEALIRWNSPEHGLISPGRFIPLFEKNGFITKIDHYMLRRVAKDQRKWLDEGRKCVPISVNVSRAHFIEEDLAEQIRDIVDDAGTPHDLIEIELTESAFFDDKNALISTIEKLKGYGFTVSMDDFGSGYSSLNSLKEIPLDVLKLDADFFRNDSGERGYIVVAEAIKLAKKLEMRTVAEGVEVKDQVDFLAEEGCDLIQGFYFAKPMPKDEFEQKMGS